MADMTMGYPHDIEIKNVMPDQSMSAMLPAMMAGSGGGLGGMGGLGGILIGALLGGGLGGFGGFGGFGNRGGFGGPAAAAIATDITLNPAFQSIQSQIGNLSNQINTSTVTEGITDVNSNVSGVGRDILSSQAGIASAQQAANFTTLQSLNGTQAAITAQNNQNALQNLNSFNQINTTNLQGFNEIGRDQANATNQIIMGQNAMAAANAACCCEIKQKITDDGNLTRTLINDLNLQNVQSQLNDAKNQISNTNQTIALENFASNLVTRLFPNGPVVV